MPRPRPRENLPSLSLAVESVKLEGTPLDGLLAFPLLRKMKNLRELDIGGSKDSQPCALLKALIDTNDPKWNERRRQPIRSDYMATVEREMREEEREERREARNARLAEGSGYMDYEEGTEEEEDDDDETDGSPGQLDDELDELYGIEKIDPNVLQAVREARESLPTVIRRLESIILGASTSEDDFLTILELAKRSRLKKLSFGLPSLAEHRWLLRRQLSPIQAAPFLSAVDKLVGLEELVIGAADDLHSQLAKKRWSFSGTLRSLELHVSTLTPNVVAFISQFTSLTFLSLIFDRVPGTESLPLPELARLPILKHLSLSFRLPDQRRSFDAALVISSFAAQPRVQKITLEVIPKGDPARRPPRLIMFDDEMLHTLLSPFYSSIISRFPSLASLDIAESTCNHFQRGTLRRPSPDVLRPSIKVNFLPIPTLSDVTKSYEEVARNLDRLLESAGPDSAARTTTLLAIQDIAEWAAGKVEALRGQGGNRDGTGATREVRELLEGLKGLYALRQLEAD